MAAFRRSHILLHNPAMHLEIALEGGAITDFHLTNGNLNPLSFAFSKAQMPERNRNGAVYQGHFLCLGRWGEPSEGEKKSGLPDHGQFANQSWHSIDSNHCFVSMFAESKLEGLKIERRIQLHETEAVFLCTETVTNTQPLGRIFNMVQHPTIAAPFLSESTRVFSNADKGFPFMRYRDIEKFTRNWPQALLSDGSTSDLSNSEESLTDVHSFIVDRTKEHGWVMAFSPDSNLLLGYVWRRTDYPWINIWRDYDQNKIRYRGLEFGTTGVHQPFPEIIKTGCFEVYNEKVFGYIDAGESIKKQYCAFQIKTDDGINNVRDVKIKDQHIEIDCESEIFRISMPPGYSI